MRQTSGYSRFKEDFRKNYVKHRGKINPESGDVFARESMKGHEIEDFGAYSMSQVKVDDDGGVFEKQKIRKPKTKVIVTGGIVEVWEYENGINVGKRAEKEKRETVHTEDGLTIDVETGEVLYDRDERKKISARNSKWALIRLIRNNFDSSSKFVTLTFRDGSVPDVTNVPVCNRKFNKFIDRMREKFGAFKYIRVIEFQDTNGRGAVHYHFISDLPYVRHEIIADIWGHGFIGINRIDQVDDIGAYMSKYLSKGFDDPRLAGKKNYTCSQNLNRPVPLYGPDAVAIYGQYLETIKPCIQTEYSGGEYVGGVVYKQFNLNREGNG